MPRGQGSCPGGEREGRGGEGGWGGGGKAREGESGGVAGWYLEHGAHNRLELGRHDDKPLDGLLDVDEAALDDLVEAVEPHWRECLPNMLIQLPRPATPHHACPPVAVLLPISCTSTVFMLSSYSVGYFRSAAAASKSGGSLLRMSPAICCELWGALVLPQTRAPRPTCHPRRQKSRPGSAGWS